MKKTIKGFVLLKKGTKTAWGNELRTHILYKENRQVNDEWIAVPAILSYKLPTKKKK